MTAWDSEHTVFKMRGCEGSSAERGVDDGVTKSSSNEYQPEEVALVQEFSWYIEASDKFTKKHPSRERFLRPHYDTISVEGTGPQGRFQAQGLLKWFVLKHEGPGHIIS